MAQTTGAVAAVNAKVEFSTNGSTWYDISGSSNSIDPGEQERQSAEEYTLDGDYAIVTVCKFQPLEITVKSVFTPTTGEAWARASAAFVGKNDVYLRWSPQGGANGTKLYTSDKGVLTKLQWPMSDATDAKPLLVSFTVKTPKVTESTISS